MAHAGRHTRRSSGGLAGHAGGVRRLHAETVRLLRPQPRARRTAVARVSHGGGAVRMREHRYSMDMPHAPERVWALMQDYDSWTNYAPMVVRVDVLHGGDADGN